jgi:hypothetical protein
LAVCFCPFPVLPSQYSAPLCSVFQSLRRSQCISRNGCFCIPISRPISPLSERQRHFYTCRPLFKQWLDPQVVQVLLAHVAPNTLDVASVGSAGNSCDLGVQSFIFDEPTVAKAVAPASLSWTDLARLRRSWPSALNLVPQAAAMTAAAAARAAMVITCDFKAGGPAPVEV